MRHRFTLRIADDLYDWIEKKAEEREVSQNIIINEYLRQKFYSETAAGKKRENYQRKNKENSERINASKIKYQKPKLHSVGLLISEEVYDWLEGRAEDNGVSRNKIISDAIIKSIKLEINARQKQEEYLRKNNEKPEIKND